MSGVITKPALLEVQDLWREFPSGEGTVAVLKGINLRIEAGEIDTTFLISHRLPLEEAATGYKNFRDNQNDWTKVVLKTG